MRSFASSFLCVFDFLRFRFYAPSWSEICIFVFWNMRLRSSEKIEKDVNLAVASTIYIYIIYIYIYIYIYRGYFLAREHEILVLFSNFSRSIIWGASSSRAICNIRALKHFESEIFMSIYSCSDYKNLMLNLKYQEHTCIYVAWVLKFNL